MYMSSWTVTRARAHLPEILDNVEAGEEITLTRNGRAVAVIVRPDSLRHRRAAAALAAADGILSQLDDRLGRPNEGAGITTARAEELVTAIRADRDR
jgi:prevent-host-death family protein